MSGPRMTIDGQVVAAGSTFGVVDPATGRAVRRAPDARASSSTRPWTRPPAPAGPGAPTRPAASPGCTPWPTPWTRTPRSSPDCSPRSRASRSAPPATRSARPPAGCAPRRRWSCPWRRSSTTAPRAPSCADGPIGVVAAITPWNYPLLLAALEARPRAARREHRRPQAVAVHAARHAAARRDRRRGAARRRGQRRQRGRRPRRLDDESPGRRQGQLHRLGGDREEGHDLRGGRPQAAHAGARAATTRRSSSTTPTPRPIGKGLFWGAFINCGQICAGIKRIYVPEALHDDVVDVLAERARAGPGRPRHPGRRAHRPDPEPAAVRPRARRWSPTRCPTAPPRRPGERRSTAPATSSRPRS